MSKPPTPPTRVASREALLCEIHAPGPAHASSLSDITVICARDVGQKLLVKTVHLDDSGRDESDPPSLTLHLPVELAAGQHPVWFLACRLACFLPDVRISVLIRGAQAFASTHRRARHRRAA